MAAGLWRDQQSHVDAVAAEHPSMLQSEQSIRRHKDTSDQPTSNKGSLQRPNDPISELSQF